MYIPKLLKRQFSSDDSAIVRYIRHKEDMAYRTTVDSFAVWCELNHQDERSGSGPEMITAFCLFAVHQGVHDEIAQEYKYLRHQAGLVQVKYIVPTETRSV